jgi:hypothetical protein
MQRFKSFKFCTSSYINNLIKLKYQVQPQDVCGLNRSFLHIIFRGHLKACKKKVMCYIDRFFNKL